MIRSLLITSLFLIISFFAKAQLHNASISSGIKGNKYGIMNSHNIRYVINDDFNRNLKFPMQVGFEYSDFFDKANPNRDQFTLTYGAYLNKECSFELEANYIRTRDKKNTSGMYYNIGFRLETEYNVSYDLKIGHSLLQLGIFYTIRLGK